MVRLNVALTCDSVQAAYCWKVDPQYNVFLSKLLFFYMLTLLVLFGNFYVRKHLSRKPSSSKKAQ